MLEQDIDSGQREHGRIEFWFCLGGGLMIILVTPRGGGQGVKIRGSEMTFAAF